MEGLSCGLREIAKERVCVFGSLDTYKHQPTTKDSWQQQGHKERGHSERRRMEGAQQGLWFIVLKFRTLKETNETFKNFPVCVCSHSSPWETNLSSQSALRCAIIRQEKVTVWLGYILPPFCALPEDIRKWQVRKAHQRKLFSENISSSNKVKEKIIIWKGSN